MRIMPPNELESAWSKLKSRHAWLFAGENIGHDCCPGWLPTLERLCAQLEDAVPEEVRHKIWFAQTKEKFGTLRAYLNVAPMRLDIIGDDGLHSTLLPAESSDTE